LTVPPHITIEQLIILLSIRTSHPKEQLTVVQDEQDLTDTAAQLSSFGIVNGSTIALRVPSVKVPAVRKNKCTNTGCKRKRSPIVGDCGFCKGHYCDQHRLLEDHKCSGLEDVSAVDLQSPLAGFSDSCVDHACAAASFEAVQWYLVGLDPELLADML
jgi:hypothetical protein